MGSMHGAVPMLSLSPREELSTHQRQVPPCMKGRCSPLENRMCSGMCKTHARGSSGSWLCRDQTFLLGQTNPVMGSGNLVFRILSHTGIYHDVHHPAPQTPCSRIYCNTSVTSLHHKD